MLKPLQTQDAVLNEFSLDEQYLLRPKKCVVKGMEVVIKFHKNQQQDNKNTFVSWTLNKITVIDNSWLKLNKDNIPIKDMDWWRVKIETETNPGQPFGCFIVRPLWKVEREVLAILAPSTWTQVQHGLTLLLYPKLKPWMPWIIPKALRKLIMRKSGCSALVIPLCYPPEGEPECYKNSELYTPFYTNFDNIENEDEFLIDT